MRFNREPDAVYKALVAELAYTITPTTVMGLTLVAIGSFAFASLQGPELLLATISGGIASLAKVAVMLRHRRWNAGKRSSLRDARRWELSHAVLTFLVAACVGTLAASMFAHSDLSLQMLATALLFGYSAGVASRISVRPLISAVAIGIAAVPTTISAASFGDASHWLLATMFGVFLVAAMQSVWHVYRTAARQIQMRLQMEHLARHDPLTGLANRMALREAFADRPRTEETMVGIHCFDLDGFKAVNDRLGHSAGDELLTAIGTRLRHLLGDPNIAARIGGDEFVVLQPGIRQPAEAERTANAIVEALSAPFDIAGESLTVGVSLGYTLLPSHDADLDRMMHLADSASYRIKRSGGGVDRELPHLIEQAFSLQT